MSEAKSPEKLSVKLQRRGAKWKAWCDVRTRWWDFLDAWESGWRFRLKVFGGMALSATVIATSVVIYPIWRERATLRMARQWLDANRLDEAEPVVHLALELAPLRAESWQLAAEFALKSGKPKSALTFAHRAAALAPSDEAVQLDWAATAMIAEEWEQAETALQTLSSNARESARGRRLSGELARRNGTMDTARKHFEEALRLEPGVAVNEVPLGVTLLVATEPGDRDRGRDLLEKWTSDPQVGAEALRVLLVHSVQRSDQPAMRAQARALRSHPAATRTDVFNSLSALALSDEAEFTTALAEVKHAYAKNEESAAKLIEWLGGTGRASEAIVWSATLPDEFTARPPVAVATADVLRLSEDWSALRARTVNANWGRLNRVRAGYQLMAERRLGNAVVADRIWETLLADVVTGGGETLFLAGAFYSWGLREEAVKLWWRCAEQPGVAMAALGSLARHYQLQRDADGLHQTFNRLRALRSGDALIANNFAYLGLVLNRGRDQAYRISRENHLRYPENVLYRSTYCFALRSEGRVTEALELFEAVKEEIATRPEIAFSYGLTLLTAGRKEEAKAMLLRVDGAAVTLEEARIVTEALKKL
ncbi:MAG: hypothetical protein ABW223_11625 [Rariglobus sp.]